MLTLPLGEILGAFSAPVTPGNMEGITNVLGDAFLGRYRFSVFLES